LDKNWKHKGVRNEQRKPRMPNEGQNAKNPRSTTLTLTWSYLVISPLAHLVTPLNEVKNFQYVELDYFTVKGCVEAQLEHELTSNQDTLGLTRLDNMAIFQPNLIVKALEKCSSG